MEELDLSEYTLISPTILHKKRTELGLTQQQVADLADIDLQQYRKFECGARNIRKASFEIACRVIRALEMDIGEFFDDNCR